MSGRKQHYIPQALLRGFDASPRGKKAQVNVFKRGQPSYVSAVDSAAAQRDYYSTLDEVITAFESVELGAALHRLRTQEGPLQQVEDAALAVAHLSLRTAAQRDGVTIMARAAFAKYLAILNDEDQARRFAGVDSQGESSHLDGMIAEEFSQGLLAALPANWQGIVRQLMRFRLREKFGEGMAALRPMLNERVAEIIGRLDALAGEGQMKLLAESLVPPKALPRSLRSRMACGPLDRRRRTHLARLCGCRLVAGLCRNRRSVCSRFHGGHGRRHSAAIREPFTHR